MNVAVYSHNWGVPGLPGGQLGAPYHVWGATDYLNEQGFHYALWEDAHGSSRALTFDTNFNGTPGFLLGTIEEYTDYNAWGVPTVKQSGTVTNPPAYSPLGADQDPFSWNLPQFNGHVYDFASDLHQMRFRYMDSTVGQFISCDPVCDPSNFGNEKSYCSQNPVTPIDPMGLTRGGKQNIKVSGTEGKTLQEVKEMAKNAVGKHKEALEAQVKWMKRAEKYADKFKGFGRKLGILGAVLSAYFFMQDAKAEGVVGATANVIPVISDIKQIKEGTEEAFKELKDHEEQLAAESTLQQTIIELGRIQDCPEGTIRDESCMADCLAEWTQKVFEYYESLYRSGTDSPQYIDYMSEKLQECAAKCCKELPKVENGQCDPKTGGQQAGAASCNECQNK